ncbi:MAG: ribosome alternative rescue factor ArfA [Pelagibacterales bacterium]|nr:ribosome alternative rescue factor ArfA [Pelagibacterales bacterium]
MKKKSRNFVARDLFSAKYKKRIVKPKKGKGSFKRKKR